MIDAGISCVELERRLSSFGEDPSQVGAVVLTHEHVDHVRGARKFCTKYDVPVYGTRGTLALTPLNGVRTHLISAHHSITIGAFDVRPFKVRHMAAEPIALSIAVGRFRVGIASDLGSVTPNVVEELRESDMLLIEANYDEEMLREGAYPEFLKRAIKGDHGHLSNDDAGLLASQTVCERTRNVILVHLSNDNNTPKLARDTVKRVLDGAKKKKRVIASEHGASSGPFSLR